MLFIQVTLNLCLSKLAPQMRPPRWKKEILDRVVVFFGNFDVTRTNYASLSTLIEDHVQEMLNQALIRQKEETSQELQAIVEQQRKENEQYHSSMQNAIANQLTNISHMHLQNLQHAQQNMLGVVVQPPPIIQQQPTIQKQQTSSILHTPTKPTPPPHDQTLPPSSNQE